VDAGQDYGPQPAQVSNSATGLGEISIFRKNILNLIEIYHFCPIFKNNK
jgi:hypothetical protein